MTTSSKDSPEEEELVSQHINLKVLLKRNFHLLKTYDKTVKLFSAPNQDNCHSFLCPLSEEKENEISKKFSKGGNWYFKNSAWETERGIENTKTLSGWDFFIFIFSLLAIVTGTTFVA